MAHITLSDVFAKAEFSKFGGIDLRESNSGVENVSDLKNFRVTEGGYLKKRDGFKHVMNVPSGTIRAVYIFSANLAFVITRNSIYRVYPNRLDYDMLCELPESDKDACFFMHDNSFYLIDGGELYLYKDDTFVPSEGYIPLYADGWSQNEIGEIYEKPNCLTSKLRLRYNISSAPPFSIRLPFESSEIVAAFKNGAPLDSADIALSSAGNHLAVASGAEISSGDVLDVVIIPSSPLASRSQITQYTRAVAFGTGLFGSAPSSLALYRGDDPSLIITTRQVSEENLEFSKRVCPDSSSMYFVEGDEINPNHGREEVTVAVSNQTSLVAFTKNSACLINEGTEPSQRVIPISQTLGCSVKDGATCFEDKIVTMSSSGFYIWEIDSIINNRFSSTCISSPIASLIPSSNSTGIIYYYKPLNELWFYRHGDERIFIYNTLLKCFYCFTGFSPRLLFEVDGALSFMSGNAFYRFQEHLDLDRNWGNPQNVVAEMQTSYLSFGDFNRLKRLSRVICKGSPNASFEISVSDPDGYSISLPFTDSDGGEIGHYEKRLPCRRSRYYSFKLTHSARESDIAVMNITLTAVK